MNISQLLHDLSTKNVELWIENNGLGYRDSEGILTETENAALQKHEFEIIEELRKGEYITQTYPLSYGQRALWFIHQLMPESPAYHIVLRFVSGHPLMLRH